MLAYSNEGRNSGGCVKSAIARAPALYEGLAAHLPMRRVEKDPLMEGRERTMMATTLPTSPKSETAVSSTPDVTNSNILNCERGERTGHEQMARDDGVTR